MYADLLFKCIRNWNGTQCFICFWESKVNLFNDQTWKSNGIRKERLEKVCIIYLQFTKENQKCMLPYKWLLAKVLDNGRWVKIILLSKERKEVYNYI